MGDDLRERIRVLENAILNLNQDVSRPFLARPELVPCTDPDFKGMMQVTGRMIGPPGFKPPREWCYCEQDAGVHDGPNHSAYCRAVRKYFRENEPIAAVTE